MSDAPSGPPLRLITMEEFVNLKRDRAKRPARPPRLVDAEEYIKLGDRP